VTTPISAPSIPVAPPTGPRAARAAGPGAASSPNDQRLAESCVEFEGVLVRQLLASSNVGAAERSGYGSMVTDALASAVTDGGGLGIAEAVRRALASAR